jgi:hypothetical protein
MKALVVYESMYGNTRHVAEAIAGGLRSSMPTDIVLARDATALDLDHMDLVVAGAPTHAWGLSGQRSREAAVLKAAKHPDHLLDCVPCGPGVREWLREVKGHGMCRGVAFDTRLAKPKLLTGSAGWAIQRGLHRAGFSSFGTAHSFKVTGMAGPLATGEIERAQQWGEAMGRTILHLTPTHALPTRGRPVTA